MPIRADKACRLWDRQRPTRGGRWVGEGRQPRTFVLCYLWVVVVVNVVCSLSALSLRTGGPGPGGLDSQGGAPAQQLSLADPIVRCGVEAAQDGGTGDWGNSAFLLVQGCSRGSEEAGGSPVGP